MVQTLKSLLSKLQNHLPSNVWHYIWYLEAYLNMFFQIISVRVLLVTLVTVVVQVILLSPGVRNINWVLFTLFTKVHHKVLPVSPLSLDYFATSWARFINQIYHLHPLPMSFADASLIMTDHPSLVKIIIARWTSNSSICVPYFFNVLVNLSSKICLEITT